MHLALTPISDCEQGESRREPFSASIIKPYCRLGTYTCLSNYSADLGRRASCSRIVQKSASPRISVSLLHSHSLVWPRNLIELETFCDTDTGHHFYCTQSPGVGSSNSTVETHLFRVNLLCTEHKYFSDTSAKAPFVWILSASRCSQLWEREKTICDNPL